MLSATKYNSRRPYSADDWRQIQRACGATEDGVPGVETAQAVRRWQALRGLPADGMAGAATASLMGLDVSRVMSISTIQARHPGRSFGIDVSRYQRSIDWCAVARAGVAFAWMKATQGTGWTDPTLSANRTGASECGIRWGLYHVAQIYREGRWYSAAQEADHLASALGDAAPPLPPAIDLEQSIVSRAREHRPAAYISDWCEAFMCRLHDTTGLTPVLYLSRHVQGLMEIRRSLDESSHWIADWAARGGLWDDAPLVKPGWGDHWRVRQVTDEARVPGIRGRVDLDVERCDQC